MEKSDISIFTIERKGIFDKDHKRRFELTFTCKEAAEKKSILVIGLNPASEDIRILDTTTILILNNLIPMGYTTITICNLYAEMFKQRLKPSEVTDNTDNRKYLAEVLKRGFDTILIGYGNTFLTNKLVNEEKEYLKKLLKSYKDKVVDIVDDKNEYANLKAVHPLMAGRYFSNRWKLRPFVLEETKEKVKGNVKPKEKSSTEGVKKKNEKGNTNQDGQPVLSIKAT